MGHRRGQARRAAAVAVGGLLGAALTAGPGAMAAHADPAGTSSGTSSSASQQVLVAVPVIPYGAVPDSYEVGRDPVCLDVFANDTGYPLRSSLQLVGAAGRPVTRLEIAGIGELRVVAGKVCLEPDDGDHGTRRTFRYRARSGNGPFQTTTVALHRVAPPPSDEGGDEGDHGGDHGGEHGGDHGGEHSGEHGGDHGGATAGDHGTGPGGHLADTGGDPVPLVAIGLGMLAVGGVLRRSASSSR